MTVSEMLSALDLTTLSGEDNLDREVSTCYIGDLLSWVMGRAQQGSVWLTIMQNVNVAAVAVLCDVSCIVLCEDVAPDDMLLARCKREEIPLVRTSETAFQLACRLHALFGNLA